MSTLTKKQCSNRKEWLVERRKSIGASDVGTILGVNEWETPLSLYLRMRGELDWDDQTERMEIGTVIEPAISRLFELKTGRILRDPGDFTIYRREGLPYQHATIDREELTFPSSGNGNDEQPVVVGVVELKNTGEFDFVRGNVEEHLQEYGPPHQQQAQLQTQMLITGVDRGSIATLVGSKRLLYWDYEAEPEVQQQISESCEQFWKRVQSGDPPQARGIDNKMLNDLWPQHLERTTIELPSDAEGWLGELAALKGVIKINGERKSEVEAMIKQALGENEGGLLNGKLVVTWKTQEAKCFKIKPSECTDPDLLTTRSSRVLRPKKEGKR